MRRDEIHMRDPFVFAQNGAYYLFGTTDPNCWRGPAEGFTAFESRDLAEYTPLGRVFAPGGGFWGTENFWAPELHAWHGGYYLFASFKAPGHHRATAILEADSPRGPFRPHGAPFVTPEGWECLDGTLHVDAAGNPWLVFCHEWVQVGDGEICALPLKDDLSGPAGEAIKLFTASEAKWVAQVHHSSGIDGYVTDGPFMVYPKQGGLWMLWSSKSETGYAISLAISESGDIQGPWRQQERPIFCGDGGHGMVFRTLSGELMLTIHTPNSTPEERPIFLPIRETAEGMVLS